MNKYYDALSDIDCLFVNCVPHDIFALNYPKLYRFKSTLLEIIDRAEPTKVTVKFKGWFQDSEDSRDKMGRCPVCGITMHEDDNFCSKCGQALDWISE